MEKWLEAGVCGKSLMLAGIVASLQAIGEVRVSRLGSSLAEAVPEIKLLSPHAVFFEMSDGGQAAVGDILREHPGLMLIGLEPGRDEITAFYAARQTVSSAEELMQMILKRIDSRKDADK